MSQVRSMIQVRGLDCPNEVAALRAALRDQEGITGLGFDLIHGTMTVDHVAGVVDPVGLARLITERTGMQASVLGEAREPEGSAADSWWSRYGPWVLTAGSGLALAVGLAFSWLGPAMGLSETAAGRLAVAAYAVAVVIGGVELFPQAARNLLRLHLDIDVLMGLAVLGRRGAGPVGRGGDGRLPVRALRGAGGPEPGPRPAVDPGAAGAGAADGRADRAGRHDRGRAGRRRCGPAIASWCVPATRSRSTARSSRAGRASTRRRSPASRCRWSASRATRSTPGRSTARGRWRSGRRDRWATP